MGLIALVALFSPRAEAAAQEKAPIPAFDGSRVYRGAGIPDRYQSVAQQIERLEKAATPTYYVVVLRSSGAKEDKSATRDYVDALAEAWRGQAAARRLPFDLGRSVIVVVAIENHQVAVHTGEALRELGLRGDAIVRDLIEPSRFYDLAKAGQYPEAISALLATTDRWIASHDAATRRPVAQVSVPAPVVSGGGTSAIGVATGLGLSLLVVLSAVIGLLWMLHRRARGRLDQRIKEVRSHATDVMDRLDALKERLKLLPAMDPDFKTPMSGETAALYGTVQAEVGRLWDRWLSVMDTLDRAQKLALGITSPFKRKTLHDAESLLDQKGLFDEIDAGARPCAASMDRLNQAHESARKELETVRAAKPQLDAQVEAIRKVGLPIAPYQEELAAITTETDRAADLITADPIGARSLLEDLKGRAERLFGRVDRVVELFREAQKLATALEGVRRQVVEHRAKGLRLDEEGGNSDQLLAQADQAHVETVTALRAGDPEAAANGLETARSMVEQAQGTIAQVLGARDYCRREQPGRVRGTERLRAALPQAEADQARLEREFAPSSYSDAARNLEQVRDLLATFDGLAADAADAASDASQRYLAAAGLLRQLAQQQQAALRLMSGLGDRLNALTAVREECHKRRGELEAVSRRAEEFFRQYDPELSTMALDILDQARRGRDSVLAAFDEPRPDWPSLRDGISKALEGLSVAQDQAEVDVRSHQQLTDEYERARAELERVASLLSGRREDRPAANRRFRSAAEALDSVGLDLSQPHGEWVRLLEQVRGAGADLEQAERLAREDIRLAGQAQSELAEAARSIEQARSYFAMGVGPDTSAARAALDRGEQLLAAQHYEEAIESAGQAQQAARRAHQEAMQQASWRQMQADADQRRWQGGAGGSGFGDALATGAAVAAGVILQNVIQGAASGAESAPSPPAAPEPIVSPQPPASDTGVGTWQSDSGQGSW